MSLHHDEGARDRLCNALAEIPAVRLGFLFGSRALGRARRDSDFDVAVLVGEPLESEELGKTIRTLAARLGREVSSERLDLVVRNGAPALLRHRVLRDGILLFQRARAERVRFAIKTIRDYQDGWVRREEFTRRRIERLKGTTIHRGSRELLERRARGLRGYLEKLKVFLEADEEEFVREPALHDLAERYLHLAVEACLDLANHWISDNALPAPNANRDTFSILERAGELSPEMAEKLRGWAGFRNILVHEYLEIDHSITYDTIQHELIDLESFAVWAAEKLPPE